jgi:hypothetical protein
MLALLVTIVPQAAFAEDVVLLHKTPDRVNTLPSRHGGPRLQDPAGGAEAKSLGYTPDFTPGRYTGAVLFKREKTGRRRAAIASASIGGATEWGTVSQQWDKPPRADSYTFPVKVVGGQHPGTTYMGYVNYAGNIKIGKRTASGIITYRSLDNVTAAGSTGSFGRSALPLPEHHE